MYPFKDRYKKRKQFIFLLSFSAELFQWSKGNKRLQFVYPARKMRTTLFVFSGMS